MVYKSFDEKSNANNQRQLAEEFHKIIIKKLKKNSLLSIKRQYLGFWFSWYAIIKQA